MYSGAMEIFFRRAAKKKYLSGVSFLKRLADDLINKGKQLKDAIEPKMPFLFKAFELVKPGDVRVVILGQDPTPQKGKATGVAFHVKKNPFCSSGTAYVFRSRI